MTIWLNGILEGLDFNVFIVHCVPLRSLSSVYYNESWESWLLIVPSNPPELLENDKNGKNITVNNTMTNITMNFS